MATTQIDVVIISCQ